MEHAWITRVVRLGADNPRLADAAPLGQNWFAFREW